MRYLTIMVLLALTLGCAAHVGKIESNGDSAGIYVSLGETTGPSGLEGGTISIPGATLVGGVFSAIAESVGAFFGRAPVVIQHQDSESVPEG